MLKSIQKCFYLLYTHGKTLTRSIQTFSNTHRDGVDSFIVENCQIIFNDDDDDDVPYNEVSYRFISTEHLPAVLLRIKLAAKDIPDSIPLFLKK